MRADLYPLQVLLVTLAGWVNRHQQHVIVAGSITIGNWGS